MSIDPENIVEPNEEETEQVNPIVVHVAQIAAMHTLEAKSQILWSLPSEVRHLTLNALPATTVAALIEGDPDKNTALLANLPAEKFHQILSLGTFQHGRKWLERAVESGFLAAAILPSLLNARDLGEMLLTSPEFRRAVPKLLNFQRAERWRQLLTTSEWHNNLESMLMSDTDELLEKAKFKDKSVKAVLQSLLDFVPELYLETINYALERSKHIEDSPEEYEDITDMPFALPEMESIPTEAPEIETAAVSPLEEVLPEGLTSARKAVLEQQLRNLLRHEIVGTGSFSMTAMQRAAGRVLSYLRQGIESFGPSLEDATRALETRNLNEVALIGARATEAFRQKALSLAGLRDWLDSKQKHFLDAMKQPEAGLHPETRVPILWLATKPKQEREEWSPVPVDEVKQRLADISTWAVLARAAFGTPERVHAIYNTAKTRTAPEALRRTIVALALYRRWEPELVRPVEDVISFYKQYAKGRKYNFDDVRNIVLTALDQTPPDAWKPSDAKSRSRELMLRTIDEMEKAPPPDPNATGKHK
jgi:hypothetical protein